MKIVCEGELPGGWGTGLAIRVIRKLTVIHSYSQTETLFIGINRDLHDAFANGQYLLFNRIVYEAIGGHEAVKDMLVEDYALAQLVKKHGYKLRFYWAPETLKVQMYRNFAELWEGWVKNIYLGIGSPLLAALAVAEIIPLGVAPFVLTVCGVL